MKLIVTATMMALSISIAFAQKTVPGDRAYVLHSEAQGTCPALDWHIVASPDDVMSGTFVLPDRKMIASVSGDPKALNRLSPQSRLVSSTI